ncbi:MAG: sodium:solute symporter family protein [Syntrophomonadaceae bacterium]|jgi:SSS family solute:Na+ symporter|nr:sodium:solute symporter family protein [Syntrophomonadaceae bacterium]
MGSFIIVIVYFAITLGIGFYMVKKQSSTAEFFVAKRGLNWYLVIPLLFAELIAGAGTVGNASDAFRYGLSSAWVNWGMCVGVFLVLLFCAKFYRIAGSKFGVMSVPAAYGERFDQKTRIVLMVILVLVYGMLFAMQPAASAAVLTPMLGIDRIVVAWVMAIFFIVLTITGGMKGLAWMNVLHSIVMYVGLGVVCFVCIKAVGGFGNIAAVLHSTDATTNFLRVDQPSLNAALASAFGTAVSFFAAATLVSVIFGSINMHHINKGCITAAILVIIFAFFPAFIGITGKVAVMTGLLPADTAGGGILYTMANYNGVVFGGLASMGVLAAILSTAPGLLLVVTTMLSRDFFRLIKKEASDKEELNFARICMVVVGILATFLGLKATSILGQMMGAFQVRAIAGFALVLGILWGRVTSAAAFWSMLIGGIIAAVWHFSGGWFGLAPLWPSLLVGMPILIILTLVAKNPIDPKWTRYREALAEAEADGSL